MYYLGYLALLCALLISMGAALWAIVSLLSHSEQHSPLPERAHFVVTLCILVAAAALLHALFWQDYSLQYAANYTDKYLSLFYRLTAFWAGQPGSMLFWALAIAIFGALFALGKGIRQLTVPTRLWFWIFFHTTQVFFLLLLTTYSTPFLMQTPVPSDGNGLNPLLQNPGMIIHPPLLFLGYAGFVVPSCLALAQTLTTSESEPYWFGTTRPMLLWAWMFLTAGILLGAWWAYMELGWGGYWAWDPVENSSLIPWLLATAVLHTILIQRRSGKLPRYNTFLITLTFISTIFATYLVRSGVIDSVHAFGQSAVGTPLLLFVLVSLLVTAVVLISTKKQGEPLAGLTSQEGLLAVLSWFLLALAVIILLATIWPVLTKLFSSTPGGLDAGFYNKVCLPLAAVILLLLCLCPWTRNAKKEKKLLLISCLTFAATALVVFALGFRHPVAVLTQAASVSIFVSVFAQLFLAHRNGLLANWGALGTHLGLSLAAIGIAFSGPYSTDYDLTLAAGETVRQGDYALTLERLAQEEGAGYAALTTRIRIRKGDEDLGILAPERRIYEKFGEMQFSEVDTIFSFGNELYASLLGLDTEQKIHLRFSIKPLVNWFWVGGILMSLLPIFALRRRAKQQSISPSE